MTNIKSSEHTHTNTPPVSFIVQDEKKLIKPAYINTYFMFDFIHIKLIHLNFRLTLKKFCE